MMPDLWYKNSARPCLYAVTYPAPDGSWQFWWNYNKPGLYVVLPHPPGLKVVR